MSQTWIQSENHLGTLHCPAGSSRTCQILFLGQPKRIPSQDRDLLKQQPLPEAKDAHILPGASPANMAPQNTKWFSPLISITLQWDPEQHQQHTAAKTVGETAHTRQQWQKHRSPPWRCWEDKCGNTKGVWSNWVCGIRNCKFSLRFPLFCLGPSQELLKVFLPSWIQRTYCRNHKPNIILASGP